METKINSQRFLLLIFPLIFSTGCVVSANKGEANINIPSQAVNPADLAITVTANKGVTVDGLTYALGEPYHAASGHRCRSIIPNKPLSNAYSKQVVCEKETGWFFAADVFGGEK